VSTEHLLARDKVWTVHLHGRHIFAALCLDLEAQEGGGAGQL